jgi:transcriptional regulator with XRE-family HTH domain
MTREQELRLRGARYGQTKPDLDRNSVNPRVGQVLRELRLKAGMTQRELADLMTTALKTAGADNTWSAATVSAIQTGRHRKVHLNELLLLARIFGVTTDTILVAALGEPQVPDRETTP